ncbi:MAG: LamG-like jellyroll fold domain-containing protein, partial [Verrucomicrobiota bacterium]
LAWKKGAAVGTVDRLAGGSLETKQGHVQLTRGDVLRTGHYHLRQGLVDLDLANQVELLIEAPARFRVDSALRLALYEGRLVATVPESGQGFSVITPGAEVIDHGTAFAVEVGADRASEVHVFEGDVEVRPGAPGERAMESVRLTSRDATRLEFGSPTPLGIPLDNNRFLRSLDEPKIGYSGMVREMRPALYFRMGVPTDGRNLKDVSGHGGHPGILIERGARRPPFGPGRVGAAVKFRGPKNGAYILVPDYPKAGEQGLSGSCWIYAKSRPRLASIAKNASPAKAGQFRWGLDRDTGQIQIRVSDIRGNDVTIREPVSLPIGAWHHVAFVADGTTLSLYRNGRIVASAPCWTPRGTDFPALVIGAQWKDGAEQAEHFWHGRIDEFA